MSKTLYRKYRPKKFDDIVGQKHIVKTLSNSINTNRLSHAYLFTGPRGTGKTSLARLFAKGINCTKRDNFSVANITTCEDFLNGSAIDLIEIDAASHTGVDNIRELRETISLAPTTAPFKVYIIDEVHMLSIGAFNALLKTLEEPPAHAIFILATTEIHKVPETIISRCQRYDFSRISLTDIITKLKHILNSEKITFEEEALEMIAISSNGGMRDAESLLAQIISFVDKNITKEDVTKILGSPSQMQVLSIIDSIVENNTELAIQIINEITQNGYSLETFIDSTIIALRALLFYTLSPTTEMESYISLLNSEKEHLKNLAKKTNSKKVINIIKEFEVAKIKISSSVIPQLPLEIAIVNTTKQATISNQNFKEEDKKEIAKTFDKNTSVNDDDKQLTPKISQNVTKISPDSEMKTLHGESTNFSLEQIKNNWSKIVNYTKTENMSLSSLLIQTHPMHLQDNKLILAVRYQLHKDKLLENKNKLTIQKAFDIIISAPILIEVQIVSEEEFHSLSPSDLLSKASSIMGGGQIVSESDNF